MISTVEGIYPGLSWDITPKEKDGKITLPAAEVKVAGNTYQMAAASFDTANGNVYLTPDGYIFVEEEQTADLKEFPNNENYWVCSIGVDKDGESSVMVLKAVKS